MNNVTTLLAMLLLGTSLPLAAADWIKPGLWEETTVSDSIGDEKKGDVDMECITEDEITALATRETLLASLIKEGFNKECKINRYERSPKLLSYEIGCPGNGSIAGKFTLASPTKMHTLWSMTGPGIKGSQEHDSRWVSADCGEHADD